MSNQQLCDKSLEELRAMRKVEKSKPCSQWNFELLKAIDTAYDAQTASFTVKYIQSNAGLTFVD